MCGIAGLLYFDRSREVDPALLDRATDSIAHRGPDGRGTHREKNLGLGHRRLAIIDTTDAAAQPFSNEDGTVWIVFNGEIYNYRELRDGLTTRHTFRSRTDTEVILGLYDEQGVQCVSMLGGMFAFAIWDARAQRLVLARDRLGKKPLYYAVTDRGLTFASELKALLVGIPAPAIDPLALHHYLTFQYVPAPLTIFQGIRKLRPGHVLVYENGKISESAYWSLHYIDKLSGPTEAEYLEEFRSLLREAVRQRLESDVPLGAFLSGGVDSSSVVALMSGLMSQPVKTFSIGFKEEAFNELPHAGAVARLFGTDHHEFVVEPSAVEILPTLVRVYDEPYADSSAIPTYYVSQLSRRHVTVVLNGDGGDELLAGYPRYDLTTFDRLASRYLPDSVRERLRNLLTRMPPGLPGSGLLRHRLAHMIAPFSRAYLGRICYFYPEEKERLYAPDFGETVRGHDSYSLLVRWFEEVPASDLLDRMLGVDTRSYLPDDLLVKVDRATMAHGLEARSPFLDHRLVEFAASLPVDLKVRNGQTKYLLKTAMRGTLPDRILDRDKMGFGVPIERWFRQDCREFVRDILLSDRCLSRGYFRPERVRQMIDAHQQTETNYGYRLYALLMLELWHREYVDGARA